MTSPRQVQPKKEQKLVVLKLFYSVSATIIGPIVMRSLAFCGVAITANRLSLTRLGMYWVSGMISLETRVARIKV